MASVRVDASGCLRRLVPGAAFSGLRVQVVSEPILVHDQAAAAAAGAAGAAAAAAAADPTAASVAAASANPASASVGIKEISLEGGGAAGGGGGRDSGGGAAVAATSTSASGVMARVVDVDGQEAELVVGGVDHKWSSSSVLVAGGWVTVSGAGAVLLHRQHWQGVLSACCCPGARPVHEHEHVHEQVHAG
eukprot:365817-Chlamydomonas_euryale.AAC.40